jgi:hypothetical protein
MAEASRGFMPRNRGAYADPRGSIQIDDAKTYFAARNRRYDLIISEPSNPWVSGVASLFTREFYRRIRAHLAPGGLLVQWFQLYEVDPSLVATVIGALGEEFPHYSIYAPSDHDLLIVAGDAPLPRPPQAEIFEHPGVAKELWTVHVLTAGDFDARYLGSRATLEPLFASYGMPANSDYAPVLDLNAARHRFMEKNATSIVSLLNADVPLLELLDPARSKRPVNPLFRGAYAFERVENTRIAWYARNFLAGTRRPEPEGISTQMQKDLELLEVRLLECREPRDLDVWLSSALRIAKAMNPYLAPDDLGAVWLRIARSPCFGGLHDFQKRWLALFRAVGARDTERMAQLASGLLDSERSVGTEAREYLLTAAMLGHIASRTPEGALALWRAHHEKIRRSADSPVFRLLRCHAQPAGPASCAADFSAFRER